ncbi:UNVERIFIED_CONTAM: hypothetical protein Sradi_1526000 [Sesamum radiatum]|uniref:Uncharacterized protein n=1 Tax=Sesamum radiatum TaxID=300843 RepID=A0AAW2U8N0_SESRA
MENTPPEHTYASGGWSDERRRMELLRMMELRDRRLSRMMGFAAAVNSGGEQIESSGG